MPGVRKSLFPDGAGAVAAGAVAAGGGGGTRGGGAGRAGGGGEVRGAGAGVRSTAGTAAGAVAEATVDAGRVVPRTACSWPGGKVSIGLGTAWRVWTQNVTPSAPATTTPKTSGIFARQSNFGASSSSSSRAARGMVGDAGGFVRFAAPDRRRSP